MVTDFPHPGWVHDLGDKLNSDARYAEIAKKWEGDMLLVIEPSGSLTKTLYYYLDLWHGKCRRTAVLDGPGEVKPAFILTAPLVNMIRILKGELDPMQAMMTRKLHVQGSMAVMMRSIPTVLDFVRCAREVTGDIFE